MKVIKPPAAFEQEQESVTIFLAGSIEMGQCEDWQKEIENRISSYSDDLVLLNPRRDDWDSSWKQTMTEPNFVEQVDWEMNGIQFCSHVFMYFDPGTVSPISLLELGWIARDDGKIIVCCPDGYFRKGNIEIFCDRERIHLDHTFEDGVVTLKEKIGDREAALAFIKELKEEGK